MNLIEENARGKYSGCPVCGALVVKTGKFWESNGMHCDPNNWDTSVFDELATLRAENERLNSRIKELEAALRPFAWHESINSITLSDGSTVKVSLRDARQAMKVLIDGEVPF